MGWSRDFKPRHCDCTKHNSGGGCGQAGWEGRTVEAGDRGLRPGSDTPRCTKLGKALWASLLIPTLEQFSS